MRPRRYYNHPPPTANHTTSTWGWYRARGGSGKIRTSTLCVVNVDSLFQYRYCIEIVYLKPLWGWRQWRFQRREIYNQITVCLTDIFDWKVSRLSFVLLRRRIQFIKWRWNPCKNTATDFILSLPISVRCTKGKLFWDIFKPFSNLLYRPSSFFKTIRTVYLISFRSW